MVKRVCAILLLFLVCASGAVQGAPTTERDLLSAMFVGPLREQVLSAYDAGGMKGAMEAFRVAHSQLSPMRPCRTEPEGRAASTVASVADRTLSGGFRIGGRAAFPLTPPVDWAADPFNDRSWRFWLNSLRALEDPLATYHTTRDVKYLRFAQSVACDWIRANPVGDQRNPFAWYDMAVGLRGAHLAYLVDASARDPGTDPETLWTLLRGAWEHGEHLADPANFNSHTNHGIFQAFGLAALARSVPEFSTAPRWEEIAGQRLSEMFTRYFSAEGVHLEHSPGYHLDMTQTLQVIRSQGLVSDARFGALLRKAQSALAWMVMPNGRKARIGDSSGRLVSTSHFGRNEEVLPPDLRYVLTRGKRGEKPRQAYRVFPEAGYAIFRSHWPDPKEKWEEASYLFFSAAFHSRTHKHADDLTFEWWDNGRALVVDAGKYGYYYDDPKRIYCESTRAHNTVEVDGQDRSRQRSDVFGSGLRAWGEGDGAYYVTAEVPGAGPRVMHRRTLVFAPGKWLVVLDELSSDAPHTYNQWFHFAPELVGRLAEGTATLTAGDTKLGVLPLLASAPLSPTLVKGQEAPILQGWSSYEARQLTPNYALGYTLRGKSVVLATLLSLSDEAPKPIADQCALKGDQVQLTWENGEGRAGFVLTRNKGSATLEVVAEP